jgi:GNAT superfamily N-acetyltransferase
MTVVTYLEMLAPPGRPAPPAPPGVEIRRLERPTVEQYRFLYNAVGGPYQWTDRNHMADGDLLRIIRDEQVEIHVLHLDEKLAGYCELDRRRPDEVELAYFGLFPEHVGRGLGRWFLAWTLDRAWAGRPRRVWLHTCDQDHPAAIPCYLKAGFTVYDRQRQ